MTACAPLTVSKGLTVNVSAAAIDSFAGSSSTVRRALLAGHAQTRPLGGGRAPSWPGPGSAPVSRQGAPGGSGQLLAVLCGWELPGGERPGHWAPSRCLGCSSQLSKAVDAHVSALCYLPAHAPLSTTPGSMRMSPRLSSNPYATKSLILSPPASALAAVSLTGATGQ